MTNSNYLQLIDAIGSNEESAWNRIVTSSDTYEDEKIHVLSPLLKTFFDFEDEIEIEPVPNADGEILVAPPRNITYRRLHMETERIAYLDSINNNEHNIHALMWAVLPNGFSIDAISKVTILAVSNEAVDEWNDIIAGLNMANEEIVTYSKDWFSEVSIDNMKNYLYENLKKKN